MPSPTLPSGTCSFTAVIETPGQGREDSEAGEEGKYGVLIREKGRLDDYFLGGCVGRLWFEAGSDSGYGHVSYRQ